MKKLFQLMTAGDWLLLTLLLAVSLTGIARQVESPKGSRVIVTCGEQTCFVGPLKSKTSVDLSGPLGKTHLVVDPQGARITSSPCPRKICMTMGPARNSTQFLACIPNRILVLIESNTDNARPYDLLSR